jgi:hypothetical protein
MPDVDAVAVAVATVAAFLIGFGYYAALGGQLARVSPAAAAAAAGSSGTSRGSSGTSSSGTSGTSRGSSGTSSSGTSDSSSGGAGMPGWQVALEFVRCLVLAAVVTGLAARADVDSWGSAVLLALALWTGFPLVLWTGAILHERTPWRLAAIHAGDWLLKLLAIAAIAAMAAMWR